MKYVVLPTFQNDFRECNTKRDKTALLARFALHNSLASDAPDIFYELKALIDGDKKEAA